MVIPIVIEMKTIKNGVLLIETTSSLCLIFSDSIINSFGVVFKISDACP
tara:strand:- start:45 stop:191 length:147 start_codon:yes stop_codon:yes gene_type:complete